MRPWLMKTHLIAEADKIGIITLTLRVHPLGKRHGAGLAVPLSKLASKQDFDPFGKDVLAQWR